MNSRWNGNVMLCGEETEPDSASIVTFLNFKINYLVWVVWAKSVSRYRIGDGTRADVNCSILWLSNNLKSSPSAI